MRKTLVVVATLAASPSLAITPLGGTDLMAVQAGEVVGAAAGCEIAEGRLIEVGKVAIALIRDVATSPGQIKRARDWYERAAARAEAQARSSPERCPAAIEAFEKAEREARR